MRPSPSIIILFTNITTFLSDSGTLNCVGSVQCQSVGVNGGHGDPSPGAEDVVPDNVNSGGPPFGMGLTMSAPKKNKKKQLLLNSHLG